MMTAETLLAFTLYAFVASVTPGPNNIMLLSSGANFGFRSSLPHISGVVGGFAVMVLMVGLGFGKIFTLYPALYILLQYAGILYLLYLSWKIANSDAIPAIGSGETVSTPVSFFGAAAFQWVNPKAWIMAVSAISIYVAPNHYLSNVLIISLVFGLVGIPCATLWATCGTIFRRFFAHERTMKIFNITMALLLVASIYPIIKKMI